MKTKSKNSEQSCDSKLETSLNSGFKFCFSVFCFSFLTCCFLTSLVLAKNSSEQLGSNELPAPRLAQTLQDANAPNVWETPNGDLVHQLWQAWISVPKSEKDKKSKNELTQMIEQIRSVQFEAKKPPEPFIVIEPGPAPTIEPNEMSPVTKVPKQELKEKEEEIEFTLPYRQLTMQTLQMLENLLQHPDQVGNPFELGEVLFLSGNTKEAAVFYQEALNRTAPGDARSAQDRAWILLQIGDCLRDDKPQTAMESYRQLIMEYPDSLWTDLANAQDKLIEWLEKDKPRTLIGEAVLRGP